MTGSQDVFNAICDAYEAFEGRAPEEKVLKGIADLLLSRPNLTEEDIRAAYRETLASRPNSHWPYFKTIVEAQVGKRSGIFRIKGEVTPELLAAYKARADEERETHGLPRHRLWYGCKATKCMAVKEIR